PGLTANIVDGDVRLQLDQNQPTSRFHFKYSQVGNNQVNDSLARDWQRALFQDFRAAVLRCVFHQRDYALNAGYEVHRSAWTLDHFAGNHPIRDVAAIGHFERAKDGQIDVTTADLPEGIGAGEEGRAGHRGDRLFAGIDQVRIFFTRFWKRTDA